MSRAVKWLIAAFVVVVALGGGGLWWFLRDDAPARVDLDSAAESVESADSSTTAPPGSGAAVDAIDGSWTVDNTSGEFNFDDATGTFAGFRIEEELAGIGSATAVGRTGDVTGTLTIRGATVTEGRIDVDLSTITTNDRRRDRQVSRAFTNSSAAAFVLTEPVELGPGAAAGQSVSFLAPGDLTLNGVTQAVRWPMEARLVNGTIVAVGSIEIEFVDYEVAVPDSQIVLSVADHGTLEFQLLFIPS